jgi:hypothetical protein
MVTFETMYFLIYSSSATFKFETDDLKTLLIQARERNKSLGISGMLIYSGGKFIQLIEGQELVVKLLYQVICDDTRHTDVTTLKEGQIDALFFEDWSMGFKVVSPQAVQEIAGIEGYKELYTPDNFNLTAALKLFKIYAESTIG